MHIHIFSFFLARVVGEVNLVGPDLFEGLFCPDEVHGAVDALHVEASL